MNCKEKMGGTSALMMAVKKKQLEIVELLMDAGASVEELDKKGKSVWTMAVSSDHEPILLKLAECEKYVDEFVII